MTEFYSDPLVTLLHGDCVEVMATLPADSVDAVVTDPPYGLEFMGKAWDRFATIRDASPGYRNPGSRAKTSPMETWGNRPTAYIAGSAFQAWCEEWGREALRVTKPGGYLLAFGGTRTHHRLVCALEDAGWIIRDELDWIYASGFPKGKANLKPAHEPIVLARKPGPLRPLAIDECRIGTTSEERAIIDNRSGGQSAGAEWQGPPIAREIGEKFESSPAGRWPSNVLLSDPELFDEPNPYVVGSGARPITTERGPNAGQNGGEKFPNAYGDGMTMQGYPPGTTYGDSGGYSRFFIVPKADRAERERGLKGQESEQALAFDDFNRNVGNTVAQRRANVHPTVKPIDLMRHLVKLVTPLNGVVLDPFMGSGTTCLAASELGVRSIGIEREAEYLDIAKDRLIATPMGLGLDSEIVGKPRKSIGGQAPASGPTLTGESTSNSRGKFNGVQSTPFYGAIREPQVIPEEMTTPMFDPSEVEPVLPDMPWERCIAACVHYPESTPIVCLCGVPFNEEPVA